MHIRKSFEVDKKLLNFECFMCLLTSSAQLRFRPLKNNIERLKFIKPKNRKNKSLDTIFFIFTKISKYIFIKKCLTTSVALFRVLKIYGYSPTLHIGVKHEKDFNSHAWIECNDKKFFFSESEKYLKIFEVK
tara:strand:- start:502 stop:897 length:396 start_codon:yes stop_codon:yes gene_type:complete